MSFSHHKCPSYDVVLLVINDETAEINHKRTKIQYFYATINPTIKLTYPFFNLFTTPTHMWSKVKILVSFAFKKGLWFVRNVIVFKIKTSEREFITLYQGRYIA